MMFPGVEAGKDGETAIYLEWTRRVLRQVYPHQDHLVASVRAVGME